MKSYIISIAVIELFFLHCFKKNCILWVVDSELLCIICKKCWGPTNYLYSFYGWGLDGFCWNGSRGKPFWKIFQRHAATPGNLCCNYSDKSGIRNRVLGLPKINLRNGIWLLGVCPLALSFIFLLPFDHGSTTFMGHTNFFSFDFALCTAARFWSIIL